MSWQTLTANSLNGDDPKGASTGAQEGNRTRTLGQAASEDASTSRALSAASLLPRRAYVGTPREERTQLPLLGRWEWQSTMEQYL